MDQNWVCFIIFFLCIISTIYYNDLQKSKKITKHFRNSNEITSLLHDLKGRVNDLSNSSKALLASNFFRNPTRILDTSITTASPEPFQETDQLLRPDLPDLTDFHIESQKKTAVPAYLSSIAPKETPRSSMYILLVGNNFKQQFPIVGYGGIEAHVESFAKAMHKLGLDFSVMVPRRSRKEIYGFEIVEVKTGPHSRAQFFIEEVRSEIEKMEKKPDVIWCQSNWCPETLHDIGIPIIVTHGDSGRPLKLSDHSNVLNRFVSENQRERWIQRNGQWLEKASFWEWEGFEDSEFEFSDDPEGYVLFVGILKSVKGGDKFLQLAKMNPDRKFVIYGFGGMEKMEKNLPDNVEFRGELQRGEEHNRAFRKASFFFMYVMWEEAFGRVVIEAFSKGTPVLASAKGSLPELIPDFAGVSSQNLLDLNEAFNKEYNRSRIYEWSQQFRGVNEVRRFLGESQSLISRLRSRNS